MQLTHAHRGTVCGTPQILGWSPCCCGGRERAGRGHEPARGTGRRMRRTRRALFPRHTRVLVRSRRTAGGAYPTGCCVAHCRRPRRGVATFCGRSPRKQAGRRRAPLDSSATNVDLPTVVISWPELRSDCAANGRRCQGHCECKHGRTSSGLSVIDRGRIGVGQVR
jgi:hypothetical protein